MTISNPFPTSQSIKGHFGQVCEFLVIFGKESDFLVIESITPAFRSKKPAKGILHGSRKLLANQPVYKIQHSKICYLKAESSSFAMELSIWKNLACSQRYSSSNLCEKRGSTPYTLLICTRDSRATMFL